MAKAKEKVELTTASQFCLEPSPVINFVKALPKGVKVGDVRFRGNRNLGRTSLPIPEDLKKMGLQQVAHLGAPIEIRGYMKGIVSRDLVETLIKKTAKAYKISPDKFYIQNINLTNAENSATLTFRRMYKNIKLPNDKRRHKLILGMQSGAGLNYHDFLAELSAKKITCTFGKTEKTIVMCSEEVMVK